MKKEHNLPENFTLSLVLVDSVPVILFCISMALIAKAYNSTIFILGAICSILAGLGKVAWKFMIVIFKKNYPWLFYQFRLMMPLGFILMIISLFVIKVNFQTMLSRILSFPAILMYIMAVITMIVLFLMAKKLNKDSARDNWIEQGTNILMQLFILLAIFFSI